MTNIVFDVGNVLIDWDARLVLKNDFTTEAEIEAFMDEIGFGPWNLEQDRGRTWNEAVSLKTTEHPEHAELISKFHHNWHDAVPGAIEGTVEILDALNAAGQALFAITNFSAEKWTECAERFPFLTIFRDTVVSAHVQMIKPDPAIFELFLDRNGLAAEDCIFIDDSPANIASASSVGIDAILFEGPVHLRQMLQKKGLPV